MDNPGLENVPIASSGSPFSTLFSYNSLSATSQNAILRLGGREWVYIFRLFRVSSAQPHEWAYRQISHVLETDDRVDCIHRRRKKLVLSYLGGQNEGLG
jgi:hypothetical protein